ncbi:MAG TPA: DUF975 family protein [Sphingobacteriaceae bacterium]
MNKPFSVREVLAQAWAIAKDNLWVLLGFSAVYFVVMLISTIVLGGLFGEATPMMALLQNILISLIDAFIFVAMYQVFFKIIDEDKNPDFPDFIPNLMKAFNFVLVKLIMGLAAVVMLALTAAVYFMNAEEIDTSDLLKWDILPYLIVVAIPFIYITVRFTFVLCFIVDQESGATESMSQSWALTKGNFWFVFLLSVAMLAINFLGAMVLLVGLLFTIPFTSLIIIIAYRQMVNSFDDDELDRLEDKLSDI